MNDSEEKRKEKKKNIRDNIIKNYSWDKTAEKYMEIFDSIEPKNMWDTPLTFDPSYPMAFQNNRQFVHDIVNKVIQSPHLLKTGYVQNMIRHLDDGYVNNGANIQPFTQETAKKNLEQLLNHKALLEKIRSGEAIDHSDFLKYGQ